MKLLLSAHALKTWGPRIEAAVPAAAVAGTRYLPAALAHMDSEHAG